WASGSTRHWSRRSRRWPTGSPWRSRSMLRSRSSGWWWSSPASADRRPPKATRVRCARGTGPTPDGERNESEFLRGWGRSRRGPSVVVPEAHRRTAEEAPMRYALLICTEDKRQAEMSEDEAGAQMAGYMAFGEEMGARGVLQGGERLKPAASATTVRVREGEV